MLLVVNQPERGNLSGLINAIGIAQRPAAVWGDKVVQGLSMLRCRPQESSGY